MENNDTANPISISAVIPAYNAEKYIARAIDSVLNQTHPVDEIVVVDDGSTDGTAEMIRAYGDKVRYIHQDNAGECGARNTGIKAASFPWVAFLDADDEWLPGKIKMQVECFRQNDSLVWISSNYERCLCGANLQKPHLSVQKALTLLRGKAFFLDFFYAFTQDAHGCSDTMLVKKGILLEAGLFRPNQKRGGDTDMWWRIAFRYPQMGYVPQPTAVYHIGVPDSASVLFNDWRIYSDMVRRNLEEAKALGQLNRFRPAVVYVLKLWLRSMLFDGQKEGIRFMLLQFQDLLSHRYRIAMTTLTMCPSLTTKILKMISKIFRALKLRQKLVRPPK